MSLCNPCKHSLLKLFAFIFIICVTYSRIYKYNNYICVTKQKEIMKTYEERIGNKIYRYFYDKSQRSWCIYEIDLQGNQIGFEGEYFANKSQLKQSYNVK